MMMHPSAAAALALALLLGVSSAAAAAAAAAAGSIELVESSEAGAHWKAMPPLSWGTDDFAADVEVTAQLELKKQTVMGFGSAMTDTSAYNAMVWMDDKTRDGFFEALWGKSGLGLSIGRVTLNSADYSFQSFNYDNVTDDFALEHFDHTLAYDHQRVMPMIKRAMATATEAWNDPIKLFASPWSPPGWMKTNDNMINSNAVCLKNDTAKGSYKQTWANYITAWLTSYKAAGLPMWGLTPQNEPEARQHKFESCAYTPELMVEFIAKHLGPTVKAKHPEIEIMAFDHNKVHSLMWMDAIYGDSVSNSYVSGTAVHWYDYLSAPVPGTAGGGGGGLGLQELDGIHKLEPEKFILNTEACTLRSLNQDWKTAALYMVDIIGDLNHWTNGWVYWNSALLEGDKYPWYYGGPNHDNTTNFGDPLLFEYNATGTQRLVFQPSYWVLGHLSRFARPGATIVNITAGPGVAATNADYEAVRLGTNIDIGKVENQGVFCRAYYMDAEATRVTDLKLLATAFLDKGGATASIVVANPNDEPLDFKLADGTGRAAKATIPAKAIQTYTWHV